MSEESDGGRSSHRWYHHLPPKLAATVVFLVALTTLLGNLFELNERRQHVATTPAAPAPVAAPETAPSAPAVVPDPPPAVVAPVTYRIGVDRIAVDNDGSPGTTDWRFTVLADGEPLFAFQQDGLDDVAGRNIAVPSQADAKLRLRPGQTVTLQVQGWRLSRLRTPTDTPDASGEAVLSDTDGALTVVVAGQQPETGAFTFYLDLQPAAAAP